MNVDESQKQQIRSWLEQGLKLSEIQARLHSELGLHLTYMELRLLVDDLKLVPKDQEVPRPESTLTAQPAPPERGGLSKSGVAPSEKGEDTAPQTGGVRVTVDSLPHPNALVSGTVTFSDGQKATWYVDQMGRLGLSPEQQGYRPAPGDLQLFQLKLQSELAKYGF